MVVGFVAGRSVSFCFTLDFRGSTAGACSADGDVGIGLGHDFRSQAR